MFVVRVLCVECCMIDRRYEGKGKWGGRWWWLFCGKGEAEFGYLWFVCTYAEFLQTDSYLFDALQFFPVRCLDALFCLPLVSESVQQIMSALLAPGTGSA